jgi:hypothetical protein
MIKPVSEETRAMKTARASAVKLKLIKELKLWLKVMTWPFKAAGKKVRVRIKETETSARASEFLKPAEMRPARGRIKAPIAGTRIIPNKKF